MFDDPQSAEAFAWLALLVLFTGALLIGGAIQGLNREWRQYLKWRRTHAAWKALLEDGE